MLRRLTLAALALALAAPAAAQAPAGWQARVDRSTNAADPDDVPNATVTSVEGGIQVNTGPAVVLWHPGNTASGTYTLGGQFTLLEPSGHVNYYGLVFGGGELGNASQNYLYFLIAQNGTFIVKHRAGDQAVHDIYGRTPHDAIATPGSDGSSVNDLEVRVGESEIAFAVNGTVVATTERTGMASRTDGIWGVRVNHRIPGVRVEGLGVR